jgi:hypothetical protein
VLFQHSMELGTSTLHVHIIYFLSHLGTCMQAYSPARSSPEKHLHACVCTEYQTKAKRRKGRQSRCTAQPKTAALHTGLLTSSLRPRHCFYFCVLQCRTVQDGCHLSPRLEIFSAACRELMQVLEAGEEERHGICTGSSQGLDDNCLGAFGTYCWSILPKHFVLFS